MPDEGEGDKDVAVAVEGKPWGFMDGDEFVEVPKLPLILAHLKPPCTVQVHSGPRHIIEKPA